MKNTFTLLCFVLLIPFFAIGQSNFHNTHYLDPYNPEYVKGEVLIKFKDEARLNKSILRGVAKTGIASVDQLLMAYQTESVEKVFKETREQRQRKTIRTIRDFKGKEIEVPALYNIYKLKFDTIWDAKQIVEVLQKDKNIEFAEPNYLVYTSEVIESGIVPNNPPIQIPLPSTTGDRDTYPNDPLYLDGSQWYLDAINAPAAWDSVTGDTTQIIAIIDTGVDWDHPDLDDNIWTNWNEIPDNGIDDDNNGYIDDTRGWDYINNDNDPNDDNSHGTHVAGIAAAEGNNGIGMCGVAWNAKIMPIKMLQSSGSGNSSDLASAIEYASNNGATVINMSLGSYVESLMVKSALENAYVNSLLVAAAGNDNKAVDNKPMFPAAHTFVLGIQASNSNSLMASFSNSDKTTGPIDFPPGWEFNYELIAPGVGIISSIPNGNYRSYNGTSMAAPLVSGICALSKSYNDTLYTDFLWAKLIFGSDNNDIVNAYNTLTLDLDSIGPDLRFIEYTLLDTLPGCDNDGIADAGETIQIYYTVKNVAGFADSVWTKIRFGEFEDTTTAIITDSTSYIGDISTWATLTGESNTLTIKIDSNVANNRDIVFEFEVGCKNSQLKITDELILTVQKGEELSGIIDSTLVLTADKHWIINESFAVTVDGTLILEPGTHLSIYEKPTIYGTIKGIGTPDSIINISTFIDIRGSETSSNFIFTNTFFTGYYLEVVSFDTISIMNCEFEGLHVQLKGNYYTLTNCLFKDCSAAYIRSSSGFNLAEGLIEKNNFNNTRAYIERDIQTIVKHNNISAKPHDDNYPFEAYLESQNYFYRNNIFSQVAFNCYKSGLGTIDFPNNYFGTTNTDVIDSKIYDFFDNSSSYMIDYEPFLIQPSDSAHGCVWKVEINGINPQNETLDPLGVGTYKFEVYFNRAMDTLVTPLLTFGVSTPYLQRIIEDNASWSADSTIWTAYHTIGHETGDGINTISVKAAKDTENFEVIAEDSRFHFIIQAAGAASIDFISTAGIGKVDLEWPPTPTEDALGYNLYRSYNLTDSTYSDTLMINTELILDTVYTDFNVIPDTTYHYFYKTLGTDLVETDYSKKVTATPFNAANGDANGDLGVDVLDITTIVSYMLNEDPSPFLFDAADVNYDNDINVLDIIALVQLINGKKSLSILPLPGFSKETAYYLMKDNKIQFESIGNVAALQFKIEIKNNDLLPLGEMSAGQRGLKIFSLTYGFEFAYSIVDDHIIGILYSMSGREIPQGLTELFRFEGLDAKDLEITEIFGGDLSGNYVPVLKKGENTSILASEAELQVNPNPFSYSTQINYLVPENALVSLKLFNLIGKEVKNLTNIYSQSGNYTTNWNGTNRRGQQLKSGIYLLQLKIKSASGNTYNKELKIVLTK